MSTPVAARPHRPRWAVAARVAPWLLAAGLAAPAIATAAAAAAAPPTDDASPTEDASPSEHAPPTEDASPTEDAPRATATPGSDDAETTARVDDGGPLAIDTVLPCGLRLLVAQDLSLPVAASVLAVETGTEDDPRELPGLVHALAFQLLEGNRDWAPGGIARMVHDGGGVTSLAVGAAQVRFEALVPASMLHDVLDAEASRLRAPSVSEPLWRDALRWARRDRGRGSAVPPAIRAAAHDAPGLAHDGRVVTPELEALKPRAIETQLADRFTYDRATLVLVSPVAPDQVYALALAAFADLPAAPRRARDRTAATRQGSAPRVVEAKGTGGTFVWPIAADLAGAAWAQAVCSALNHLKRDTSEPTRARLRCAIEDEPRRAVMLLRATAVDDPLALVRGRLARLLGDDLAIFERERDRVIAGLAQELRTPLALARYLARSRIASTSGDGAAVLPLSRLLGAAALAEPLTPTPDALAPLLDVAAAVHAVDPTRPPSAAAAPTTGEATRK